MLVVHTQRTTLTSSDVATLAATLSDSIDAHGCSLVSGSVEVPRVRGPLQQELFELALLRARQHGVSVTERTERHRFRTRRRLTYVGPSTRLLTMCQALSTVTA